MRDGGPVWPVAELLPEQGRWTVEEYLKLTDSTNRLVEFTDGRLEFLPMPTPAHQLLLRFLFLQLYTHVQKHDLGEVLFAALRVELRNGKFREPDLLFLSKEKVRQQNRRYYTTADLVMEVVSPEGDGPKRDWIEKRRDYAEASGGGIPEYWIIDPRHKRIVVLVLDPDTGEYVEHQDTRPGDTASSKLLSGFTLDVAACFASADDDQDTA